MHHRTASTIILGITAALALAACSPSVAPATQRPAEKGDAKRNAVPMTSAQLRERLLDESDLGDGHTREPDRLVEEVNLGVSRSRSADR